MFIYSNAKQKQIKMYILFINFAVKKFYLKPQIHT